MKPIYLILLLLVVYPVKGQFMDKSRKKGQCTPPGQRKILLRADSISVGDVLRAIYAQTGIAGFFPEALLNKDSMIKADFAGVPLDTVMACLLGKRGLGWKYDDNLFFIKVPEESKKKPSEKVNKDSTASLLSPALTRSEKSNTKALKGNTKKHLPVEEKIWLHQPRIAEVRSYEEKTGSGLKFEDQAMNSDFYPLKKKHPISLTPLMAERWEAGGHLPIYARYFYTPADSLVRLVTYDWLRYYESRYSDNQEQQLRREQDSIQLEEDGKIEFYMSEFKRVTELLMHKFGPPTASNITGELLWDKPGYDAKLTLVFRPYAHYIRLKLYWKK